MSPWMSRAVFLVVAVFFLLFFLLPIWGTLRTAFQDLNGRFTLEFILEVFRSPLYREGLFNSGLIAVLTTFGCLLLALPL
ncbi:MAG: iron ABC transporter permease, partial [Methylococcus sp.]